MRVVGYLRVSTAKQQEKYGLVQQREDVQQWADTEGHTIVAWRMDVLSGTLELDDRDGWQEVAALIQQGKAEAVVVGRLDRLARDFMVQELLLRNLSDFGGKVFSTRPSENEMINGDRQDPARELVRGVLGLVSEYDRKMTVLKLRSARAIKARAGGYAHGALPYGMRSKRGVLVPVPKEQRVIERIRALSEEGRSSRQIAAQLTAEAVPTKRGGNWTHATVLRVLGREKTEKRAS